MSTESCPSCLTLKHDIRRSSQNFILLNEQLDLVLRGRETQERGFIEAIKLKETQLAAQGKVEKRELIKKLTENSKSALLKKDSELNLLQVEFEAKMELKFREMATMTAETALLRTENQKMGDTMATMAKELDHQRAQLSLLECQFRQAARKLVWYGLKKQSVEYSFEDFAKLNVEDFDKDYFSNYVEPLMYGGENIIDGNTVAPELEN